MKEILKDPDIMKQLILSKLCKKAKTLEDIDFGEEEMKCRRIITTTNTVIKQKFIVNVGMGREAEYPSLRVLLKHIYWKQGELYKKEFGIDYDDAYDAGWEPDAIDFCGRGWYTFLRDRRIITRTKDEEVVEIVDLVREWMDDEDDLFV